MKKYFLVLLIVFSCSFEPLTALNVSGNISSNTVWGTAGSPYVVTSSVTIDAGITLAIDPGVTVLFDNNQFLYVNGSLIADGVTFTSANGSPSPGDWGGIEIGSYYAPGSAVLTGCFIGYANNFNVSSGSASLTNTQLSNFYDHGIILNQGTTLQMTGGIINTSSNTAMQWGNGIRAHASSIATLSGVSILNFHTGILLFHNSDITISGVSISGCNYPVIYNESANLNPTGMNFLTGNQNDLIQLNFNNMPDTMNLPYQAIPYYFPHGMTVQQYAQLTIASNNILKFGDNTSLGIDGTLIAEAANNEQIYFTSFKDDNWGGDSNKDGIATAPAPMNWVGVIFGYTSNDTNCLMRRCHVRYAGGYGIGGISMIEASPTIDQCELSANYFGIMAQAASNPVLSGNLIGTSVMTPIAISYEADPVMTNNVLSFMDNEYDAIGLLGGPLTKDAVLKIRSVTTVQNMTYLMLGEILVPAGMTLTIQKGIVIKSFSQNHRIVVEGTLIADATIDSMITFTSAKDDNYGNPADMNKDGTITSPVIGDWGGIVFNPGSNGTLEYCRFQYGEVWNYGFSNCSVTEYLNGAAIGMIDANPSISNCLFKDLKYGISCYRVSNPTLTNLDMTNIQYTPICISGSSNPSMTGITFTNVGWRAIGLLGGNVCNNGTIIQRSIAGFNNITYVLLEDMKINSGTYINIVPGVVIKANQWHYSYCGVYGANIIVDGGFKADATASQRVVFTSIKDDNAGNPFDTNGDGNASTPVAGDWGQIKFRSSSDDTYCKLNYVTVKYGGSIAPCQTESGVSFENAGCTVSNTIISGIMGYGLFINGNSNPAISSVTIQNCTMDPIAMSLTSDPSFTNITFVSNLSSALKIIEGTLSSNAVLTPRNVAGINNIAYIISNLTIATNAKLTIAPGVVIKFRADNFCGWYLRGPHIIVEGNLYAAGTANSKIQFTSFADDSKGGDSNNDGNISIPNPGDWGGFQSCGEDYGGIRFFNNSSNSDTVNFLKNCEFSYFNNGVWVENSHATFDSCTFQLASQFGAKISGSSNPEFRNCQFYNIAKAPVELSMFSDPVFINCTALNVGFLALAVIPETYSQSDTVPLRNFGGFTNIGYLMTQPCTINSGTSITIPAGAVFKSSSYDPSVSGQIANGFIVNGRLNILGTPSNPVVFTHTADDAYGNPQDMNQNGTATVPPDGFTWGQGWSGTWIQFNDESNDSSMISNALFRYGDKGILTTSASPSIEHSRFEHLYFGIDMNGVSAPGIDNCTFHNLRFAPVQISLVSYPATSANNIISGTTYKMLMVRDETLTQDVILPKRNFGGISNIPYCFGDYNIGTGATLTIAPGVVCKFKEAGYWSDHGFIRVFKGLMAQGGSTPDSTIVFTSILDDFYGGDSNADGVSTTPANGSWKGLVFEDQSLDPFCKLKNCIIRYADNGISTFSASPAVQYTSFNNNNTGAYLTGASNPVFNECDFIGNYYYAVNNVNQAFIVNAEHCWWGNNLGPVVSNIPGTGAGAMEYVSDYVDFVPWKTNGVTNPLMGDVSLNGLIQAYDASLVLRYTVQLENFSPQQQTVADVSGASGITAYDASLILQYIVGLIQGFPAELAKSIPPVNALANATLTYYNINVNAGDQFDIPLRIINPENVKAFGITLKYDPQLVKPVNLTNPLADMQMAWHIDTLNGFIHISSAGIQALDNDTIVAILTLDAIPVNKVTSTTSLVPQMFMANETNYTPSSVPGIITINNVTAGIQSTENDGIIRIFPNPSSETVFVKYNLTNGSHQVYVAIYNILGQLEQILFDGKQPGGEYTMEVNTPRKPLEPGSYTILFIEDGVKSSYRLQIIK